MPMLVRLLGLDTAPTVVKPGGDERIIMCPFRTCAYPSCWDDTREDDSPSLWPIAFCVSAGGGNEASWVLVRLVLGLVVLVMLDIRLDAAAAVGGGTSVANPGKLVICSFLTCAYPSCWDDTREDGPPSLWPIAFCASSAGGGIEASWVLVLVLVSVMLLVLVLDIRLDAAAVGGGTSVANPGKLVMCSFLTCVYPSCWDDTWEDDPPSLWSFSFGLSSCDDIFLESLFIFRGAEVSSIQ